MHANNSAARWKRLGKGASVATLAAVVAALVLTTGRVGSQESVRVESLRGDTPIPATDPEHEIFQADVGKRFVKNFRQQPPLIPHRIDSYEIDLKVNQCLRCHDWPQNVQENAPKISETHYQTPAGKPLDQVSRARWFCVQCHVPQADAKPLVENTFKPAKRAP